MVTHFGLIDLAEELARIATATSRRDLLRGLRDLETIARERPGQRVIWREPRTMTVLRASSTPVGARPTHGEHWRAGHLLTVADHARIIALGDLLAGCASTLELQEACTQVIAWIDDAAACGLPLTHVLPERPGRRLLIGLFAPVGEQARAASLHIVHAHMPSDHLITSRQQALRWLRERDGEWIEPVVIAGDFPIAFLPDDIDARVWLHAFGPREVWAARLIDGADVELRPARVVRGDQLTPDSRSSIRSHGVTDSTASSP